MATPKIGSAKAVGTETSAHNQGESMKHALAVNLAETAVNPTEKVGVKKGGAAKRFEWKSWSDA